MSGRAVVLSSAVLALSLSILGFAIWARQQQTTPARSESVTSGSLVLWHRSAVATYVLTFRSSIGSDADRVEWEFDASLLVKYAAASDFGGSARVHLRIVTTRLDTLGQSPKVDGGEFSLKFDAAGGLLAVERDGGGTNMSTWFFDLILGCNLPLVRVAKAGDQWEQDAARRWKVWRGIESDASVGSVHWSVEHLDATKASLRSEWLRPSPHQLCERTWVEWDRTMGLIATKRARLTYQYDDPREPSSGFTTYESDLRLTSCERIRE